MSWPAMTAASISSGASAPTSYYNMDQVVGQALTTFAKIAGVRRPTDG